MVKEMRNKGQVALFILVALVIVIFIGLLFFLSRRSGIPTADTTNPEAMVTSCVRAVVHEAVDIILPQGGFISPVNYKTYKKTNIAYLCEHIGYFKTCIQQHPALLDEMRREILTYAQPKIEQCFTTMEQTLQQKDYQVTQGPLILSLSFGSDLIVVDMQKKILLSKQGTTRSFQNFHFEVSTPLYDLSKVAQEIANQEAKYCYFEYVGYMLLYPKFSIEKIALADSTKIYTITDKKSGALMNIALRSCALPPGI